MLTRIEKAYWQCSSACLGRPHEAWPPGQLDPVFTGHLADGAAIAGLTRIHVDMLDALAFEGARALLGRVAENCCAAMGVMSC
jgi:hypothetical protein